MKNVFMTVLVVTWLTAEAWSQGHNVLSPESGEWEKLGESTVFFYSNTESWRVLQMDSLQLTQAKLRVLKAPMLLIEMLVFYSSGGIRSFPIQLRIDSGMEAGPFLLDSDRLITSVAIKYKSELDHSNHFALIEFYGKNTTSSDSQVKIYKHSPD